MRKIGQKKKKKREREKERNRENEKKKIKTSFCKKETGTAIRVYMMVACQGMAGSAAAKHNTALQLPAAGSVVFSQAATM